MREPEREVLVNIRLMLETDWGVVTPPIITQVPPFFFKRGR
jgi:hypothetical protein